MNVIVNAERFNESLMMFNAAHQEAKALDDGAMIDHAVDIVKKWDLAYLTFTDSIRQYEG